MKIKKGIALLITVVMLAALSILVLKSYNISGKFIKDNDTIRVLAQSNRLFLDSKKIFKANFKDLNDTQAFQYLFSKPFVIPSNVFKITFIFNPVDNRVNINKILHNSKINKEIYSLLENILISYNVEDSDFFLKIVLDTIDKDNDERVYGSEIAKQNRFFSNGEIYSKEEWMQIIDYYAQNRDDKNIYKIPWSKYIGFKGNSIDINFASLQLIKFLLPNQTVDQSFKDKYYNSFKDLSVDKKRENILKKIGVVFDTSRVLAKIRYNNFNKNIDISYIYDIKYKSISDIKYTF